MDFLRGKVTTMGVQEEERERAARRLTCGTAAEDGGERNRVGFIWFFFFLVFFYSISLSLSRKYEHSSSLNFFFWSINFQFCFG